MIAYIFKSSLSLILLFGLYWFLLRKEKLFIFNRFFLVLSVAFSLVLPFISVPLNFQTTRELKNIIPSPGYIIPEISISENIASQDINIGPSSIEIQPSGIDITAILVILYISGAILFLLRFLKNIFYMYSQIKLSEKVRFEGYRLMLTNEKTNPYCFFNNIFLNKNDYLNERIDNDLLNHELMHIRQYHSVDIIFLELIKIFYWFNPVYLLYDRAIRINHEYLADYGVIHDNYDIKNYSDKLLSFIFTRSNIPLTSGSNYSFMKKRFIMMMKPESRRFIYGARIAMTICLGTVFFLLLSFKESDRYPLQPILSAKGTEMTQNIVRGIVLTEDRKPLEGSNVLSTESLFLSHSVTKGNNKSNEATELSKEKPESLPQQQRRPVDDVPTFQINKLNSETTNLIEKSIIQQDKESDKWWQSIVKKHDLTYESYTSHYEFVILGKGTINNDLESFKDVIAIENSGNNYWMFRSKTASYNISSKQLEFNDCTMEKFDWNSKSTEPLSSYKHINFIKDFNRGLVVMNDTLTNSYEWWQPIVQKHNIALNQFNFKNIFRIDPKDSTNNIFFEMGTIVSYNNGIINLKDAIFIFKAGDNKYFLLTATFSSHDLNKNVIEGKAGNYDLYKLEESKPITAIPYQELKEEFKLVYDDKSQRMNIGAILSIK